mmetsp:Transcript_6817/g.10980  ORF Transcript_6817/g.10980 Transcript_6817/m.10980 type:complete len:279 (-) Transcript_6817:1435-2271(-)
MLTIGKFKNMTMRQLKKTYAAFAALCLIRFGFFVICKAPSFDFHVHVCFVEVGIMEFCLILHHVHAFLDRDRPFKFGDFAAFFACKLSLRPLPRRWFVFCLACACRWRIVLLGHRFKFKYFMLCIIDQSVSTNNVIDPSTSCSITRRVIFMMQYDLHRGFFELFLQSFSGACDAIDCNNPVSLLNFTAQCSGRMMVSVPYADERVVRYFLNREIVVQCYSKPHSFDFVKFDLVKHTHLAPSEAKPFMVTQAFFGFNNFMVYADNAEFSHLAFHLVCFF